MVTRDGRACGRSRDECRLVGARGRRRLDRRVRVRVEGGEAAWPVRWHGSPYLRRSRSSWRSARVVQASNALCDGCQLLLVPSCLIVRDEPRQRHGPDLCGRVPH